MLATGSVVVDRYEVEALLGSGGLADVYRVRHLTLGSHHALKMLSWDRPSVDRRLLLEGQIQAQLRHPNIVAVTDVFRVDGRAALLLDYVEGPNLEAFLQARGEPLPTDEALDLFAGILAAVVRAHDAGVLHRDLKPQNVLLARQGDRWVAKITDFGLAKVVMEELAAGRTRADVTMGTPGYMAPEQVRDAASVDARTDVFALGVLLHELLSGARAFVDDQGETSVTATVEWAPRPLPDRVPERLRDLVATCLAVDPEARFADARALAEALLPEGDPRRRDVLALTGTPLALAPRRDALASLPTSASTASATLPTLTPPPVPRRPEPTPSRRGWAFGLAAVGLAALVAVVVGMGTGSPEPVPHARPNPVPVEGLKAPEPPAPPPPRPEPPPAVEVEVADGPLVSPTPAPTAPPVEAVRPAAVPAPAARPDPAPAAPPSEPVPAPAPVPAAAPEPSAETPPAPTAAVAEGEADVEAAWLSALRARWVGEWSGRTDRGQPLLLRVDAVTAEGIRGALVFTGPTARTLPLSGLATEGALSLSGSDGTVVSVAVDGARMTGSYGRGNRRIPFTASR